MDKILILFDEPRVRRVISPSMPRTMGRFPSRKSGRTLHWESQLEMLQMIDLEVDPQVIRFKEQPITVKLKLRDRTCRYTPDIYAEQDGGRFIYEVKPEKVLDKYADLFDAAHQLFAENGYQYVVVTDKQLKKEPQFTNRRLLWRYTAYPIINKAFDAARAFLLASGGCSVGALAEVLHLHGGSLETVYALIARGFASAVVADKLLTTNTIIKWR